MQFIPTEINGLIIIEPKAFGDSRGYFLESFKKDLFEKHIGKIDFIQENESRSSKGVLRGLHLQKPPFAQAKLVRVVEGEVIDVALDVRKDSPTFGKSISIILSAENKRQFFVPRGFAHGFAVLSDYAIFQYKIDNIYSAENEVGIIYNDPDLNVDWEIEKEKMLLSAKDLQLPKFKEVTFYNTSEYLK
jgi:dTDP-4-dehydrorhamnose 3,5-epimerase